MQGRIITKVETLQHLMFPAMVIVINIRTLRYEHASTFGMKVSMFLTTILTFSGLVAPISWISKHFSRASQPETCASFHQHCHLVNPGRKREQ